MHRYRALILALLLVPLSAMPARADATAFLGTLTTPSNRPARGFAVGFGVLFVGAEFEYANVVEDKTEGTPSLRTGSANVLFQTPFALAGLRPYATTGVGVYREELAGARRETNIGLNTGGGLKVSLFGPLRARVDYRVFKLRGQPLHSVVHRTYVGLNLSF